MNTMWVVKTMIAQFIIPVTLAVAHAPQSKEAGETERLRLPTPRLESAVSLERALHQRRSVREFDSKRMISLEEISQLLWSAQGITASGGFRTAPSAGALYPLEVYLVAGHVQNLPAGIYHYQPDGHQLRRVALGDRRKQIARAALQQEALYEAPATIVFSVIYERTTQKYRERGRQYALIEVGHAAQNVLLQAVALGLGAVPIGAFYDHELRQVMGMKGHEEPIYLIPVGKKRS
ncbi:MAG: SagB/ThcOx family dehydrogenase [Acidobacteriota bacterium]|nr:SagB/ThcOx family dehydrogenase [Blastocatellia bacterium]MDW8238922.1 SagB/ThcOx family dehydrogenase [Acidobacteriota bacterium]